MAGGSGKRVFAWGVWGAGIGLALGYAAGLFQVSRLDCTPNGVVCEWSGFVPIAGAFWGFWGGLILGVIACLIYLENKRPPDP